MTLRGAEVSPEAGRDAETKLLPIMGDARHERCHCTRRDSGASWYLDETYPRVHVRRIYLCRAVDGDGNLIDAALSEDRDRKAAETFFRWAKAIVGFRPDQVTTHGHGSYPRAVRSVLGKTVRPRTIAALRAGSDLCAASRIVPRPAASAASMVNFEIRSVRAVTLKSSPLPLRPRRHPMTADYRASRGKTRAVQPDFRQHQTM